MAAPGAQLGRIEARLALLAGVDPAAARDAEIGLAGVVAGPTPMLVPGASLLQVEPRALVLSALEPAQQGEGVVVRLLNPTDTAHAAIVWIGFPVSAARAVRLDEGPAKHPVALDGDTVRFEVPPRALRSVLLE
jgi:alpha-mannosidase